MDGTGFLPVIRRWGLLMMLAAVVAGAAGWRAASNITPTYEARERLVVGPINTDIDTLRASSQLTRTYAELARSRPLLEKAAAALGPAVTPGDLKSWVHANANDITRVLTIRATNHDPAMAAKAADAVAQELIKATSVVGLVPTPEGTLQLIEAARTDSDPVAPNKNAITITAGLAGLLIAFAIAFVAEAFSRKVRSDEHVTGAVPVEFLGTVEDMSAKATMNGHGLNVDKVPSSHVAVASRLVALGNGHPGTSGPRKVVVAGAQDGKGTGRLAARLAGVIGRSGRKVVLVDAKQDGEITSMLNLSRSPGVTDLLAGTSALERCGLPSAAPGVRVVPKGLKPNGQRIDPEDASLFLDKLLDKADFVIVSADPISRSPNTLSWSRVSDATIVVARQAKTTRQDLKRAADELHLAGAETIGTVLSKSGKTRGR